MTPRQPLDHLRALADLVPPPQLSERIARAHAARTRRLQVGTTVAALAVACVCALPLLQRASPQRVPPQADDALADIRALDRALQTAYARNASEDELAPLWDARKRLLVSIQRHHRI